MCFDCCMVLVVGLSLSSEKFRCCHRCPVYVSSCLLSPAQARFGQTPRELDCTTAHMLQYHLEFVCLVRQAVVYVSSCSDKMLMSSPGDGEEVDDCCALTQTVTLLPFPTTSGFVQWKSSSANPALLERQPALLASLVTNGWRQTTGREALK